MPELLVNPVDRGSFEETTWKTEIDRVQIQRVYAGPVVSEDHSCRFSAATSWSADKSTRNPRLPH